MKISEIFLSIDGEGKRSGKPAIFIRRSRCNLSCSYCDTVNLINENCPDARVMNPQSILREINQKYPWCTNVTFTGGEPLLMASDLPGADEIANFLQELKRFNYDVNIETNGSIYLEPFLEFRPNIWFTMDYKCPSSGMESLMVRENIRLLDENDVLKFVVGADEDLDVMKSILEDYRPKCQIYVSPVWGEIELTKIAHFILDNKLSNVNMQIQLHKVIWGPDAQGV